MKNFNFNNITSFKDFLNSLKEINNEYYKITLYNIKIDTFEENINFFGELHFNNCIIKNIYGTFDFNRLFFNNCNKLCEINLFSSINSLIITNLNNRDKKNNKYDKLKIIGNYKNLNYFYFSAAYTQRNILFDGIFNNDEILNFIFYSNIINLKFKGFYNNILLSNTSRIFKDKRNCELDDFYDDIIINKLILNNYYNNISFDFNGFIIFDIIYDTINKFDNLINYMNSDITLKDDNDKCKNITFGGYLLKKK